MMPIQDIFKNISERLQSTANVRTVYGDPVVAEGKTILPIARVRYGFGAGSGGRMVEGEKGHAPQEMGGGGGGGVEVTPVGFVEVTPGETRYVMFDERRRIVRAVVFGMLVAVFLLRRRLRR